MTPPPASPSTQPVSIPATFGTVVERDHWLWEHSRTPLLVEEKDAEERFMEGGIDSMMSTGVTAATYACQTAASLRQTGRLTEASAYWLAAVHMLCRAHAQTAPEFDQAVEGYFSSIFQHAGLPAHSATVEGRIKEAIKSPLHDAQREALLSLLHICAVDIEIFDRLDPDARRAVAEKLVALPGVSGQGHSRRRTQEVFGAAVKAYSTAVARLRNEVDGLSANPTAAQVRSRQQKLLQWLGDISAFSTPAEGPVIERARGLLSTAVSGYLNAAEDQQEEHSRKIHDLTELGLDQSRRVGTHNVACILGPLFATVEAAMAAHYRTSVQAQYATISLSASRPEARRNEDVMTLELAVSNTGPGPAENVRVGISLPTGPEKSSVLQPLSVGTLPSGGLQIAHAEIPEAPTDSQIECICTVSWRDRVGDHNESQHIKIGAQRVVAWSFYESAGTPYPAQSISTADRLKGRGAQLAKLKSGIQGKGSFALTGQRRVGKTSLTRVALADAAHGEAPLCAVYVPLGELAISGEPNDLGQLGHDLARQVADQFELQFTKEPVGSVPDLATFVSSFNSTFTGFIKKFSRLNTVRLVLALDDMDELPTSLFRGAPGRQLFLAFRALIDTGVSFLFVGSERLPAIFREQGERLNVVRPLRLDHLDIGGTRELVTEPARDLLEYTDEAVAAVHQWSSGNPYFATLLASALWERAIRNRDYWVTDQDVALAVEDLSSSLERFSFQHFWSDSPVADDEERQMYEAKTIDVLRAFAKHQQTSADWVDRDRVAEACSKFNSTEAGDHIRELVARDVLSLSHDGREIRVRIPLFAQWLSRRGMAELADDASELDERARSTVEVSSAEIAEAAAPLSYRGRAMGSDDVRNWLNQFGSIPRQRLMLRLLRRVSDKGIYDEARIQHSLEQLHKLVLERAKGAGYFHVTSAKFSRNMYVAFADHSGKSGSTLVKPYRSRNRIPENHCGDPTTVIDALVRSGAEKSILVIVNDFVGSGRSAALDVNANIVKAMNSAIADWRDRVLLVYGAVVGFEDGISALGELVQDLVIVCPNLLTSADKAFSPDAAIFDSGNDRLEALKIAREVGEQLEKKQPLGYEDSQALIVFADNVPNNTLPIFWKSDRKYLGNPWRPLFPRA